MSRVYIAIFLPFLFALGLSIDLSDLSPSPNSHPSQTNDQHHYSLTQTTLAKQPSSDIPVYSVYLSDPPQDRYRQITSDKKELFNQFVDYLYLIGNFKWAMWLARGIFVVLPEAWIRGYLGEEYFDQCKGIAEVGGRHVYEVVVYNFMYEIGAAKDFCTSIALAQVRPSNGTDTQTHVESILARNLDYGFQKFLVKNTVKINFYQHRNSTSPQFTTLSHAGFVSTHTVLKYQAPTNLQFSLSLNQRRSQNIVSTFGNIIFTGCESVFQLVNRLMVTDVGTIEQFVGIVAASKSCSGFYFIVQVKGGDHVLIEKNAGVGVHQVYLQKLDDLTTSTQNPFFILQTNTDQDKQDPDGRRDQAIEKINNVIKQQQFVEKEDLKRILLEPPNFNDKTLMTAIIDVEKGEIDAMVWDVVDGLKARNVEKMVE